MGLLTKLLPDAVIRKLNAALQGTSSDRFARVFHASPDWIVITRLSDSLIVEANQGFESLSGYKSEDAIGNRISKFNIWAIPQEREHIVATLARDGVVRNMHAKARRSDGSLRDFEVSATLIAVDGTVNSHAVWIARDITEAQRAVAAVRESEARFSLLFEQSPVPMCYASADDGYASTQWNAAWFETFGFRAGQHQGMTGLQLQVWVHPQDRERITSMVRSRQTEHHMEADMRRADGHVRRMAIATRWSADSPQPLLISTFMDITEREESRNKIELLNAELESRVVARTAELQTANRELSQTLETLRLAKDQLVQSEKLAALGSLVAGVSHELNTPIGNGLTVASALEHRVEEFAQKLDTGLRRSELQGFVDEARLAAEILTRNLGRAGHLVTSFKQVAVDQTSSQRREFSLALLVSEIVLTLAATTRKYSCVLRQDIAEDWRLESYPGPLGQVLTNLINNALLHGFEPLDEGSITIAATPGPQDTVQVTVRDTGKGIAPENINRIFEPFFTTRLGQGGSGLGLHIVHNIVSGVLGGTIRVVSEPGGGCEFTMVLPRVAPCHAGDMAPDSDAAARPLI